MRRPGGRKRIGQMLIEKGLITEDQLNEALKTQQQTTQMLGEILVDLGYVQRAAFFETLAEQMGVSYVDLTAQAADPKVATLVPQEVATRHQAIPIARGDGCIRVAMAEPGDVMAADDLKMHLQQNIEPLLADPDAIKRAITKAFEQPAAGGGVAQAGAAPARAGTFGGFDMQALADQVRKEGSLGTQDGYEREENRVSTDRIGDMADEAPIIKIAKVVLQRAIEERSSDIHIEPYRDRVRIRYRIDGVLHEVMQVPKYVHAPLISRFKIMSDMNIAERRVPQDGRIHVRHSEKEFDLRSSVIPTTLGEKFVMRILDKSSVQIGLESLGFDPSMLAELEKLIHQPNGMILSTGPTGSGKTTTQYSILNRINSVEINIITIEEPVEYQLDGIAQVDVNRKAGLTFAVALKYFLRQDPDVILVGEIRDLETSEIAIQAALTGHLVLSTLHTNDAPSTITRLVDMGVEPFLISSSVIASMSQRLARKICENCREPYDPPRDMLMGFGFDPDAPENRDMVFYHGRGCENCRQTGYRGRIGVYELMTMNQEIAELIVKRASAGQIKEAALAAGMVTLQKDGFRKVLKGVTTVEELTRIVFTAGSYSG
ncbi:MAG: Flp pilus assembly complex ATPase component TadA [Armatimonadetes bacterium]|jgi:type IV pilus assembly protein PilB|nr:Flp pilus assembly complex ATPase component TadA [Armatimonadota bacterium]